MTRAAVHAASLLAAFLLLFAPLAGPHAAASAAPAAALALLSAVLHRARVLPLAAPAEATRARVTAWSSTLLAAVLPQRDPDAAGKPRPRAPGAEPLTV